MKSLNYLLVGMIMILAACDDNEVTPDIQSQIEDVQSLAKSGDWIITYYFDDKDETADYAGYTFTFNENGSIIAKNGSTEVSGTWSVTRDDDSNDDNPDEGDIDFNINFISPEKFAELSDDWDIKSRTSSKIELIDVSGGNGGTDFLTFERK
ncbi:hypothetical protein [Fulvivirga sedimenti]|uniref:Lipocalin-like domain-containing protein n=1 Tax=Fulvivirga sedimenti TaxID=2879465 RepID=A0A9X1HU23_9BACT|nr:hypothetical protein [Fulvivirga sedimenti]MCA6074522.1 hypothetical protein [Fulvivirga sedimenti]MCA6075699.1 hypothetical protein [Fulvivirga sedimenti]MCA6076827.1 hypothetical protein [Fulvivirga sedimenti]